MALFERARKVAARTMSTDEWKDDLRKEDRTKAKHFRQVARLTDLGMIIEGWQAGRAYTYASRSSGSAKKGVDRSFVVGFVSAEIADALVDEMTRTDKYVARMHLGRGRVRQRRALPTRGKIAVTGDGAVPPKRGCGSSGIPRMRKV